MIFGVKAHMTVGNLNIGMTDSYPVQDPSGPCTECFTRYWPQSFSYNF
jgi:hypothetical protein